jgi:AcrR family transcriptional regulator
MVDSRILQTQSVLAKAILDLAGERPVSEISVAEVARRAGINRATFYNHFLSPGALLASVITRELDRVRDADLVLRERAEEPSSEITRRAVDAVVALVQRHRRLFELTLLDPEDASLHRALSSHFEVSCRQHLQRHAVAAEEAIDIDIIARYVAEGIVGGIEGWLGKPEVTASRLTDAIVSAMPRWWH